MSEPNNHFNSFNVYTISLNKNDNQTIYDYFLNELYQQNTNNLNINYNINTSIDTSIDTSINININIIFYDLDDIFTFYIFKEDASLYTIYEDMIPYSIIYNQTDTEKEEFIDFLNYLNINEEPYINNNSYMN
jgi:hypothetical protein